MALFGPSPCWIHHLHPVKIWQWACFPFDKMGRGLGWIQVYMSDLSCVSLTYGWCCHCFDDYPTHSASMSNCLWELKMFWHTYRKISLQIDISHNSVKINPCTSSGALSIALAFLFLPTMALGRPDPTPFTSSLSGEHGLEPAPLPLLVFLVSSFFGNWSLDRSSLLSSTHSSRRLLTIDVHI